MDDNGASLFGEPEFMPVITLWQPWASLIFCTERYKRHETRGFRYPAKYDGSIVAIHAAAAFPAENHITAELNDLCYDAFGCGYNYSLPRGCIIGTVQLGVPVPTEHCRPNFSREELAAGNYADGRWAWPLLDIWPLAIPIPAKGKQGWWKVRADVVHALAKTESNHVTG